MRSLAALSVFLLANCGADGEQAAPDELFDVAQDAGAPSDAEADLPLDGSDTATVSDAEAGPDLTEDATETDWCWRDVCGPPPVTLEVLPDPFGHEIVHNESEDVLGLGSGAGFVDFDGDGDFDVLLGSSFGGTNACLYENESSPGALSFTPVAAICERDFERPVYFAAATQLDDDSDEELILGGSRFLELLDLREGRSVDLIATLEPEDARRRCDVMNVRRVDLDADGFQEIYVGCGHAVIDTDAKVNIVFDWNGEAWQPWTVAESGPLAVGGATLAVAVTDLDRDGLADLFYANDTFSNPDQRNVLETPGGWIRQLAPGVWEPQAFSDEETRYGSFMGAAFLPVAGDEAMIVTDWGPPRSVDTTTQQASDFAAETGWHDGHWLFSWSALTFDFDGNGLLDAYVTFGDIHSEGLGHEDRLYLQFVEGFAILPRSIAAPGDSAPDRSSRGVALVDLDGDGSPELFTLPLRGPPVIDRIQLGGEAPSCAVVADQGAAVVSATVGESTWTLDSRAQCRFAAPSRHFVRGVPTVLNGTCAD